MEYEAKTVALVSGGMDSTTLAYLLDAKDHFAHLIAFDYGQSHSKEVGCAYQTAERLGFEFSLIELHHLAALLRDASALTAEDSDEAIPDEDYSAESLSDTVVPNRNAVMLTQAFAIAAAEDADYVAAAMHAADHEVYPDCRPEFARALDQMQKLALEGLFDPVPRLYAPFINEDKAYIAELGDELGVPWETTWTCYKGNRLHCGTCSTCRERKRAFDEAGVADPTEYEDPSRETLEELRR